MTDSPPLKIDALRHLQDEETRARIAAQNLSAAVQTVAWYQQQLAALGQERDAYKREIEQLKAALAAEKRDGNP